MNVRVNKAEDQIESLNFSVENLNDSNKSIQEVTIPHIEEKVNKEANERLALDVWGRKWNLVVRGIKGDTKEKPQDSLMKIRDFFKVHLKINDDVVNLMLFQAVHRLPNGPEGKRNIIVRFLSLMDRDIVLNQALSALGSKSGFSVVPDLPPPLARLRYELLGERKQMSPEERSKHKLIYLKESPFLKLVRKR